MLALVPAMSLELIKLNGEINRIPFVASLVISWSLPGTCHQSRDIFFSEFISADGVDISELYRFNNMYCSKSYLYHTRYNKNAAFEH